MIECVDGLSVGVGGGGEAGVGGEGDVGGGEAGVGGAGGDGGGEAGVGGEGEVDVEIEDDDGEL